LSGLDQKEDTDMSPWSCRIAAILALVATAASVAAAEATALQSLPALSVPPYMGRWYQVALYPNRFQRQCVSDTTAEYRRRADGAVDVMNRCRLADGRIDEAAGLARPTGRLEGDRVVPAQLEVSFLPVWLRWLPVGWGSYWVIQLADDGRYAVVAEPSRQYLWVLSRTPQLVPADDSAIRSKLVEQGFDLQRLAPHPQSAAAR
jgi:apolipoprotein D and lipocalin family protein